MNSHAPNSRPRWLLLTLGLAALGSVALLAGCKGNTTAAATPEHRTGKPPVVQASRAPEGIRTANPLASNAWQSAGWVEFASPINARLATPMTRCGSLYDEQNLYFAVICHSQAVAAANTSDTLSFYLDTTGKGNELLEIRLDGDKAACTWMRSSAAAKPLEDGTPDLGFPVEIKPDIEIKGLWLQSYESENAEGKQRAVVVGVPLASLPVPMRVATDPGKVWKLNVVRTITTPRADGRTQRLESDLSPIYSGAQAVSPYRMADLRFSAQ